MAPNVVEDKAATAATVAKAFMVASCWKITQGKFNERNFEIVKIL